MRVHLLTLFGYSLTTGKNLLDHYAKLGVTSLLIFVHVTPGSEGLADQVTALAAQYSNAQVFTISGDWLNVQWAILSFRSQFPDDWFIVADQDEFHLYPRPLIEILAECERRGFDCVSGAFVDRVSADGSLPPLDPARDLWSQYPVGALITATVCNGNWRKIVLAKGRVQFTNEGHHETTNGVTYPIAELCVQVHHFKWIAGVVEYLESRTSPESPNGPLVEAESMRFVYFWRASGGRIPLNEPGLLAAPCNPDYPHWETVRRLLLMTDLNRKCSVHAPARR